MHIIKYTTLNTQPAVKHEDAASWSKRKEMSKTYRFWAVWKSGGWFVSSTHPGANIAADTLSFFITSSATFVCIGEKNYNFNWVFTCSSKTIDGPLQ